MKFFVKNLLIFSINLIFAYSLSAKTLIFDLSDTLLKPSDIGLAWAIGPSHFINHLVLDLKNPRTFSHHVKKHVFDILDMAGAQPMVPGQSMAQTMVGHHARPFPGIMYQWQVGTISGLQAIRTMDILLRTPAAKKKLPSVNERRLVQRIIHEMFNPATLAHNFYPIDGAEALLKECYCKGHTLIILSNFDKASFDILYHLPQANGIFKYFKPENIILSGKVGMIKPHTDIYQYVLNTYHVAPSECIFIDDRPENIAGAAACGIEGILVKDRDIKSVHRQLHHIKVL